MHGLNRKNLFWVKSLMGSFLLAAVTLAGCTTATPTSNSPVSVLTSKDGTQVVTTGVNERKFKVTTLSNGMKVKVINVTTVTFTDGGDPPALLLKYQTDLPIGTARDLQDEATKIWQSFKLDVEKAGLTTGIITASSPAQGGRVWNRKTYTFGWKKGSDNVWRMMSEK